MSDELNQSLFEAASRGDLEAIEAALARGADIEAKNAVDMTALTLAARDGQIHAVLYLLEQGAQVSHDTILVAHMSVYAGPTMVKLLQLAQIRQVQPQTKGLSPANARLLEAACQGNLQEVREVIQAGADVAVSDHQDTAALRWAARWGHREVVEALLEAGADVNQASASGWTALMEAVLQGHEEIAVLLVERGADVNARTFADASVLYFARDIVSFSPDKERAGRIIQLLEARGAIYSAPEADRD